METQIKTNSAYYDKVPEQQELDLGEPDDISFLNLKPPMKNASAIDFAMETIQNQKLEIDKLRMQLNIFEKCVSLANPQLGLRTSGYEPDDAYDVVKQLQELKNEMEKAYETKLSPRKDEMENKWVKL